MFKRFTIIIPFVVVTIIILIISGMLMRKAAYLAKDLVEIDLPSIQLYSLKKNQSVNIKSLEKGYSIIHIFATWCTYCKDQHIYLKEIQNNFDIPIYGLLYADKPENLAKLGPKMSMFKDILLDEKGLLLKKIGASTIPDTLVIKNNKIIYYLRGRLDNKILSEDLYPLLKN